MSQPAKNRKLQSISVIATIPVSTHAVVVLSGDQSSHRPRTTDNSNHGSATNTNRPEIVPPTLARSASTGCPRTR